MNKEMAKDLLRIKAIQINPKKYFTWTSGLKSPIYCDNRLTMSYPDVRKKIVEAFVQKIEQLDIKPDVIAGCATAGIPHAAWLAEALNLPMVYVRSERKSHGKENQIEGALEKDQRVIVIEDLISTGGSALHVAKALQEAGAEVLAILAIFTYRLPKATERFAKANLSYETITTFDDVLKVLVKEEQISEEEQKTLKAWRDAL